MIDGLLQASVKQSLSGATTTPLMVTELSADGAPNWPPPIQPLIKDTSIITDKTKNQSFFLFTNNPSFREKYKIIIIYRLTIR